MDKAAFLPTAQDFQPIPQQKHPQSLYSIALSLSSNDSSKPSDRPPSLVAPLQELASAFSQEGNSLPLTQEDRDGTTERVAGPITVEWVDFSPSIDSDAPESGSLNLPPGIVHLYRHSAASRPHNSPSNQSSSLVAISSPHTVAEVKPASEAQLAQTKQDTNLVAVLAVPSYMTPSDFLSYVGQVEDEMECLRMIRDVSPARSLVLIKFRSQEASIAFIEEYNGKPFNSLEPETCHVVPILNVLTHYVSTTTNTASLAPSVTDDSEPIPTPPFPITLESERPSLSLTDPLLSDTHELPTCAVCLERMDSAVTGLITVPCSHSFHCACLSKWADSRCPVCRYSHIPLYVNAGSDTAAKPTSRETTGGPLPSSCSSCATTENLWICLICGSVGCGRYSDGKHAQRHFERTGHMYSLELETQRVWNYAADEYVHRLIQNKSTGGLVELPASSSSSTNYPPSSSLPFEKLEAISLEYSHLLSSQLSAQRTYFHSHQEALEDRIISLEDALSQSERGKEKERIRRLERDLQAEKEISKALQENLYLAKGQVELVKREMEGWKEKVRDGEEQIRDLMFFLEARDKIAEAEQRDAKTDRNGSLLGELQGGTVVLPAPPPGSTPPIKSGGGKKKKGKKR